MLLGTVLLPSPRSARGPGPPSVKYKDSLPPPPSRTLLQYSARQLFCSWQTAKPRGDEGKTTVAAKSIIATTHKPGYQFKGTYLPCSLVTTWGPVRYKSLEPRPSLCPLLPSRLKQPGPPSPHLAAPDRSTPPLLLRTPTRPSARRPAPQLNSPCLRRHITAAAAPAAPARPRPRGRTSSWVRQTCHCPRPVGG